ncbi:MAG TPA: DUF697 domain-containing protein [Rhodocyclaceae bacterium]|nr:DUF697 domain-containing protein [Rhodocyclaceae bacterium]
MVITRTPKQHTKIPPSISDIDALAETFIAGAEPEPTFEHAKASNAHLVATAVALPVAVTDVADVSDVSDVSDASVAPDISIAPERAAIDREQQALALVKHHLPWAAGAAFVPVPGLDLAAIFAVQLRMLNRLSAHYHVPFRESAAKSSIATLMAMLLQGTLAGGAISLSKFVPFVGTAVAIAALPAFVAAGTYAIGVVFITHFAAGGTFLDFDPKKVEKHFRQQFEQARKSPIKA